MATWNLHSESSEYGSFFSMKNPFIGCLKSYFSAKILVKICPLKIQKRGVRQAEYQYMPVPLW
jgi:hypothetical protein